MNNYQLLRRGHVVSALLYIHFIGYGHDLRFSDCTYLCVYY